MFAVSDFRESRVQKLDVPNWDFIPKVEAVYRNLQSQKSDWQ